MSSPGSGMTRRDFLKVSAAAFAAAYLGWGDSLAETSEAADMVLLNGKIITVDASNSIAQAVAIRGDKIQAVGSTTAIRALVGPATKVIDLDGRTVTPGIIDAHIHPMYYGRNFWEGFLNIRFPGIKSFDELRAAIEERVLTTPEGQWISGNQGFYFTQGDMEFDKHDLDVFTPNHPLYLRHGSGQYSVVNSRALQEAGIDAGGTITPNPFGGRIVRDPVTNEPTGVLLHYPAENLVMLEADGYKDLTDEILEDDFKKAQDVLLAAGITSVQDVIVGNPRDLMVYKNLGDKGELKMRVYLLLYINSAAQAQQYVQEIQGFESDYVKFGGWKLAIDGGVAPGTTLMYDTSLPCARQAYYYYDPPILNGIVHLLHETGRQISFHIIGDKGIDEALNAVQIAFSALGQNGARHRIEHLIFPSAGALSRIRDLGIVASMQPQFLSWFADGYRGSTNETVMARCMPIKTMLQMGIPMAFGCDVPAAIAHHPKWAFIGATTREALSGYVTAPNEVISIPATLEVHTMGSAYAEFAEDRKGSIEPGKFADLVVWSHDLYSVTDPEELEDLTALMTIVGGKIVAHSKDHVVYMPSVQVGQ